MIKIKHLRKAFGENALLKDVELTINRGDVIALIGPSGVGKTTFLRCLASLEEIDDGQILFDDVDIRKNDLKRKIGLVFQSFNLFEHLSVAENIMAAQIDLLRLPKQKAYDNTVELLQKVGLEEKILQYPGELSGGQKQRVAIARAIALKPEILLLDEPTSALDEDSAEKLLEIIQKQVAEGMTLMIVTHDLEFAKKAANRFVRLENGILQEEKELS